MMKEPKRFDLPESEAEELIQRLAAGRLKQKDYAVLGAMVKSWLWLSRVVRDTKISIQELKKLLFGAKTEKTSKVLKQKAGNETSKRPGSKRKTKGHGRNGSAAYTGAERVLIACSEVCAGDRCPRCEKGKLYGYDPSEIVCIRGQAPIQAKVYEQERLRCNLCGAWLKAPTPAEAAGPKYDPSSAAMMAQLHYGCGFPFNRLEDLQKNLGVPLPSSTQWDVIHGLFHQAQPIFDELNRYAAGGELFHNDDTTGRVLALEKQIAEELEACRAQGKKDCRTGVFTTGIISVVEERRIALFFTGRKHAGENLSGLLEQRPEELPTPIQMCDALSRNAPKGFRRLLGNCLCHGRREFIKLIEDFPDQCRHVLETVRDIYQNEALSKEQSMSKEDRLLFHQKHSGPIMEEFFKWLNAQLDEKRIEPNSRMGGAINYMINHWEALTLFLRVPGAPLDNNVVERGLKMAIRHRKNSLFFKTERGALVGDLFMSLIHTCRLNGINAFTYLTAIAQHPEKVAAAPADWLPWNYHDPLVRCASP